MLSLEFPGIWTYALHFEVDDVSQFDIHEFAWTLTDTRSLMCQVCRWAQRYGYGCSYLRRWTGLHLSLDFPFHATPNTLSYMPTKLLIPQWQPRPPFEASTTLIAVDGGRPCQYTAAKLEKRYLQRETGSTEISHNSQVLTSPRVKFSIKTNCLLPISF